MVQFQLLQGLETGETETAVVELEKYGVNNLPLCYLEKVYSNCSLRKGTFCKKLGGE